MGGGHEDMGLQEDMGGHGGHEEMRGHGRIWEDMRR